jgi:hypothetical protein
MTIQGIHSALVEVQEDATNEARQQNEIPDNGLSGYWKTVSIQITDFPGEEEAPSL